MGALCPGKACGQTVGAWIEQKQAKKKPVSLYLLLVTPTGSGRGMQSTQPASGGTEQGVDMDRKAAEKMEVSHTDIFSQNPSDCR